jgi:ATP-dependent RNA helicase RhlE
LNDFTDLGLAEPLLRAVTAEGYSTPTPIQAKVIPALLAGRDVIGIAQTGTGKTASFVLPLLDRLARDPGRAAPRTCGALVLAPTRELAAQIAASVRAYGRFLKLSVAVVVGGVKPGPQVRALAGGVDILVATPGRLLDHMAGGAIRLDRTTTVILDEGDQMLDLGFIPAIRRIMGRLPKQRQTVLMSATMPPPIRALAHDFQTDPVEIAVAPEARPIELITQSVRFTDASAKRDVLARILSAPDVARAIVFTRTKRGADRVQRHLENAGLSAAAIHGNKSQTQRERTLAGFRSGGTAILVATDIAARGIDIDDVTHVINFELPNVPEAYVHRIGRTARAGRAGVAISLCDAAERPLLRDIERLIGTRLAVDGAAAAKGDAEPAPAPAARQPAARQPSSGQRSNGQRSQGQRSQDQRTDGQRSQEQRTGGQRAKDQRPGGERPAAQPASRRRRRRKGGAQNEPSTRNPSAGAPSKGTQSKGNQSQGTRSQGTQSKGNQSRGNPSGGDRPAFRRSPAPADERVPGPGNPGEGLARMLGNSARHANAAGS